MKLFITAIMGLLAGVVLTLLLAPADNTAHDTEQQAKPLYWVAPMDANYRRDKPGKSPMGMDLVPVYASDTEQQVQAGVVQIAPHVVNNLGVKTLAVTRQALTVPINTVGYVRYNEDTLVHIHPRVEGWVDTLYVKTAGQKIQQGEPLYALYSPQLVNAQEEFLLARKRQNASLSAAALERLHALQMPQESIAQLSKSDKVLQTVIFTAPQSGVVDNLNIREGFFVKPGTTLLSIGALDQVWVEAEIYENQASLVKEGLKASMTLGYLPGEQWHGELDYIYPTLDALTRTVRVRLRFANPDRRLKPNMFAKVSIHSDATEYGSESLVVPRQAVIRTGQQDRVVLALGQGQFKSVEVKLGLLTQHSAQILAGLEEGDEVVVSAQFLIDSESSIASDFQRMSADNSSAAFDSIPHDSAPDAEPEVQQATVSGQILQIDSELRILTIHRAAIEKWQRPAATIDFSLADGLSIDELKEQQLIEFSFEIRAGDFVITDIQTEHSSHTQMEHKP